MMKMIWPGIARASKTYPDKNKPYHSCLRQRENIFMNVSNCIESYAFRDRRKSWTNIFQLVIDRQTEVGLTFDE